MYTTYYSPSEHLDKDTVWKDFAVKKKKSPYYFTIIDSSA